MTRSLWCIGHQDAGVLADVVVHLAYMGAMKFPSEWDLCIDCADAFQDAVDNGWEDWRIAGLRNYWWAKHPNCEALR